jgi:hypothetical protein
MQKARRHYEYWYCVSCKQFYQKHEINRHSETKSHKQSVTLGALGKEKTGLSRGRSNSGEPTLLENMERNSVVSESTIQPYIRRMSSGTSEKVFDSCCYCNKFMTSEEDFISHIVLCFHDYYMSELKKIV